MLHRLLVAVALLSGSSFVLKEMCAAEDYPYAAYVIAEQADVLSGPSRRFYITHQLFPGDQVQVYRREAAGWLGIRPPEDSFSWIRASAVEDTDDAGVYRVLTETTSWVGTSIEDIRDHTSQVKLRPGELIEAIGEKKLRTANGEEIWFKIAPPAGEFRWIHTSQVSKSPPREQDSAVLAAKPRKPARDLPEVQAAVGTGVSRLKESLAAIAAMNAERAEKPTQPAIVLTDLGSARTNSNDIRLTEHQQPVPAARNNSLSADGFVPRKPRKIDSSAGVPAPSIELRMASREQMQNSIREPNRELARPEATPKPLPLAQKVVRNSAATFDTAAATEQLTRLDLELSLHVAQPRETWNLDPIRDSVQRIVDGGQSPQERGQARLLLEKIRQFEETFTIPNDPLLAAARSGTGGSSPSAARYDGVGLLQPVLSRDGLKAAASYALVDSDGNPVAFVTPGPGLNLRKYENKPVGIYGKRGMIEALKKPHLVAERVIDLSTR